MPTSDANFDVVIVGAGPAGSAAAIELARAGRRVLLLDKQRFPRDKVCGGSISGAGTRRLHELLGPRCGPPGLATTRITFVVGSHRLTCCPNGMTWMVHRAELDACLAAAATSAGAEARFGESASLELRDDRWDVRVGSNFIAARTVLVASGIGGLAKKVGIAGREGGRTMIAQQWIQSAGPPLPRLGEVELHWLRGGYIGLATPRPGECVVALAAQSSSLHGADGYDSLRNLNPDASVFNVLPADAPRRFAARGTAGFPWLPERFGDRNLLLIGDAAGYAEPYSGEGIGQALESADCAVRAVLQGRDLCGAYASFMQGTHRRSLQRSRRISGFLQWRGIHYLARHWPFLPEKLLSRLVARVHVGLQGPAGRWPLDPAGLEGGRVRT